MSTFITLVANTSKAIQRNIGRSAGGLTQRNFKETVRVAGIGTLDTIRRAEAAGVFNVPTGFGQSLGRMQQASSASASTMSKIVGDPSTPASARAKVGLTIVELGKRATQLEDMAVKLAALEQAAESAKPLGRS